MPFTVATYNILASAYIKPEWYPRTPAELLEPGWRVGAVAGHLGELGADLGCLQEVERAMFDGVERELGARGYAGRLALKARDKPDGCAAFFRSGVVVEVRSLRLVYADAHEDQPQSGHVAQILVLKVEGRVLGVANTHLKWDQPKTARDRQYGLRQMRELLEARRLLAPECEGWVVCGDLNVTLDSAVAEALREAGFRPSHDARAATATCNPNGRARRIDFIFHDAALCAEPLAGPVVVDETPLPGPEEPSDHVAVMARMAWVN